MTEKDINLENLMFFLKNFDKFVDLVRPGLNSYSRSAALDEVSSSARLLVRELNGIKDLTEVTAIWKAGLVADRQLAGRCLDESTFTRRYVQPLLDLSHALKNMNPKKEENAQ